MSKFKRVESDDPTRCQATGGEGQCPYQQVGEEDENGHWVKHSDYCWRHGANVQVAKATKQNLAFYNVAKWRAKLNSQTDHPNIKNLREDIGVLRMLLETRLEMCNDINDLAMASSSISELVVKIEKLVTSCQKLDFQMGNMLDKTQLEKVAIDFIEVISKHVTDPEVLQKISVDLVTIMEKPHDSVAKSNSP